MFEVFQGEYEKHPAAYTISSDGTYEFVIAIGALEGKSTIEEESRFIVTPADQIVSCSCRLFERNGILCRHALKGHDLMNIKLLSERYILKRWTQDARSGIVQDMHGKDIVENPKLDAVKCSFHWLHELLILKTATYLWKMHFIMRVSR